MNVRDIKTKARSMIATNRSSIVMIFLFIGIMMVAINYLIEFFCFLYQLTKQLLLQTEQAKSFWIWF